MNKLGQMVRNLRETNNLPLRVVASFLDIDQAILSKIEHGKRKPKREQVIKLAEYFHVEKEDLLVAWLADKVLYEIGEDDLAIKVLRVAEKEIVYTSKFTLSTIDILNQLKHFFSGEARISRAWLFGSVARNEATAKSDIDVMIEFNKLKRYSMMDILDIQYKLQSCFNRKVDVVEKGFLKDFAKENVEQDLKLIIAK
jgi:predicted nucleotidyltransferase/DNA-binding XRE family transcriptional regulator